MSAGNVLNVIGCLFLVGFVIEVVTTAKTHPGSIWKSTQLTLQVSMGGPKGLLFIGGILGLALTLFQPILSDWLPPIPALLSVGVSLLALNGACLPPTFLFLAASREPGFLLASDVQISVAPLKIVHLLNSFEAGPAVGESIHRSEYRVADNWQRAVRTLSAISPVIIVDIRELTPNVYTEIIHLVETGLHYRVFLVADGARAPKQVSRLCHRMAVRICIVTPQLLQLALSGIGWTVLFHRVDSVFRFLEADMLDIARTGRE
jgi:hypothetical protein